MARPPRHNSLVGESTPQAYAAGNGPASFSPDISALPSSTIPHGASWAATREGGAITPGLRGPVRFHDVEPGWSLLDQRPQQVMLAQNAPQLSPVSPSDQTYHPTISSTSLVRTTRRNGSIQKLPTVPSTFVERQKKNTVSKRRGPLSREDREKAHRMRQRGPCFRGPCFRCRLYKVGVRMTLTFQACRRLYA
jgi:hypothetical protein